MDRRPHNIPFISTPTKTHPHTPSIEFRVSAEVESDVYHREATKSLEISLDSYPSHSDVTIGAL